MSGMPANDPQRQIRPMDQRELAAFRRTLFIYMTTCLFVGLAGSLMLYVLLPTEAVFAIAAVIFVVSLAVGILMVRRIRAFAHRDQ